MERGHCRKRKRSTELQVEADFCGTQVQDVIPECQTSTSAAAEIPQFLSVNSRTKPSSPPPDLQPQALRPSPQSSAAISTPPLSLSPRPETSTSELSPGTEQDVAAPHSKEPLKIHGHSVEEYQKIYHSVVDEMLKYKSGRPRRYSLQLGRIIKQRLWERLGQPKLIVIENTDNPDEPLKFQETVEKGAYPPLINIDLLGEPDPHTSKVSDDHGYKEEMQTNILMRRSIEPQVEDDICGQQVQDVIPECQPSTSLAEIPQFLGVNSRTK